MAHNVNAAARKNGPENALVTRPIELSPGAEMSERHSSSSGLSARARATSGSLPTSFARSDLGQDVLSDAELVERRDVAVEL